MAFGAQEKGDLGLRANVRPGSIDPIASQRLLFPLEAFEFTDPNRNDNPELRMKPPWRLVADYISSSGDPWNTSGNLGIVPEGAYFGALRATSEISLSLLNKQTREYIEPTAGFAVFESNAARATIAGTVIYDMSQITGWTGDYTIIVKGQSAGWNYLTSTGLSAGGLIDVTGDDLTISSSNILPQALPFLLLGNTEWFQDLVIITSAYSQSAIDDLIGDIDHFALEEGTMSDDRGFILSPDGFYWYNGGQYISLGTEAIFGSVDLHSGEWDGEITDGEITTNGTAGWALSYKGDIELNDAYIRGDLQSTNWDGTITNGLISTPGTEGWALTKEGDFEASDGTFRGSLEAAEGTFGGLSGSTHEIDRTYSGTQNSIYDALEAVRVAEGLVRDEYYSIVPDGVLGGGTANLIRFSSGVIYVYGTGGTGTYTNGSGTTGTTVTITNIVETSISGRVQVEGMTIEDVDSAKPSNINIDGYLWARKSSRIDDDLVINAGNLTVTPQGSGPNFSYTGTTKNFTYYNRDYCGGIASINLTSAFIRIGTNNSGLGLANAIAQKYGLASADYGSYAGSFIFPMVGTYGSYTLLGLTPLSSSQLIVYYSTGTGIGNVIVNPTSSTTYNINGTIL